ncbi:hypothetical protein SNE40_014460 [Patella caerulea]|uniref:Fork-head domain-containing protein n=1 Tax=Patella caerulea TaxID=87958 RepID=A0AAN8JDL2_PATCE
MTSTHLLAARLLNNWLIKNPIDRNNTGSYDIDENLTGLRWLQSLNVGQIKNNQNLPVPSQNLPVPSSQNLPVPSQNLPVHEIVYRAPVIKTDSSTEYRYYKNNGFNKPPYSYAILISMAINETKEKKINLSSIYKWITVNFPYYKMADSHWKNSIRHNLSLNKRFEKISRRPNESGKGGYWRIKPEMEDIVQTDITKKRRASEHFCFPPSAKRTKIKEETLAVLNYDFVEENRSDSHLSFNTPTEQPERVCKTGFSWSSVLQQDIEINGIKIKTENILNDDSYGKFITPEVFGDAFDVAMSSPVSSCDVNSGDMTCVDDLLVFTDESTNIGHDESRDSLDLFLISDGSGDHDWWQKDFDKTFNKNHGLNTSNYSTFLDNDYNEICIPPLDNVDNDIDIFNMFNI